MKGKSPIHRLVLTVGAFSATILVGILALAGASLFSFVSPALAQTTTTLSAVIDFEGLTEGQIVDSVSSGSGISGDTITGSVDVFGVNPTIDSGSTNTARIFDATCTGGCTGDDPDLEQPTLGNVLIIDEDLIGEPDDADIAPGVNVVFQFDFSGFGPGTVTVESLDVVDIEAGEAGVIELFAGGSSLGTVPLPMTGDGGLATVNVGVSGVDYMEIRLDGTGAIDNIRIQVEEPEEPGEPGIEGCTPGYWKQPHHMDSWPIANQDFDEAFGLAENPTGDADLVDALNARGGGVNALMRHAAAALLNAESSDVDYAYSTAEVTQFVQDAFATQDYESAKNTLEEANESLCPLD